jgi:GNAT superfamily N-acetyltransferase
MGDEASDVGSAVALGPDDAGEVLTLQRAAYVSEAQAHDDLWLPPLTQTLNDLRAELARPTVRAWGYRDAARLVAAVRVEVHDTAALIGRLVVVPDRQNHGLGSRLLLEAEQRLPDSVTTLELFTGEHSHANLRLYRRLGYDDAYRSPAGAYELIHLRKPRPS